MDVVAVVAHVDGSTTVVIDRKWILSGLVHTSFFFFLNLVLSFHTFFF